jgi:thiamine biosynthesis lipoprotein
MRVERLALIPALAALLLAPACRERAAAPADLQIGGAAWGMTWKLTIVSPGPESTAETVKPLVEGILADWENALSHWKPDSELSRFNDHQEGKWFNASARLLQALELTRDVGSRTDGALDPTIGALVNLWGFGAAPQPGAPPGDDAIEEALSSSGWCNLDIEESEGRLRKLAPGFRLNLAAVAEGLAIDEIAGWLRQQPCAGFLLELGGEVAAHGLSSKGKPWTVGIQAPDAPPGETFTTIQPGEDCLSTSGTYLRRRALPGGVTISHLIDPRTGRPVDHRLRSVTVRHASAALADAYATALLILGPEEGPKRASELGLDALWIIEPESTE